MKKSGKYSVSPSGKSLLFNSRNDLESILFTLFKKKYSLLPVFNFGDEAHKDSNEMNFNVYDSTELLFRAYVKKWIRLEKGYNSSFISYNLNEISKNEQKIAKYYRDINDKLFEITSFEINVKKQGKKEIEKILTNLFGSPRYYYHREKTGYKALELYLGESWIGNLVDEHATIGKEELGYPMQNFEEFFASTITTLAFDGKNFFSKLTMLKELKDKNNSFAVVFSNLLYLLTFSYKYSTDFYSELVNLAKINKLDFSSLDNLKSNLDELKIHLK